MEVKWGHGEWMKQFLKKKKKKKGYIVPCVWDIPVSVKKKK